MNSIGIEFTTWKRTISDLVAGKDMTDDPGATAASPGFDGDHHPKAVLDTDEFDVHSLATLRQKVDRINLDTVRGLVDAWQEIADRNATSLDEFSKQIAKGTAADVWSGAAATAAGRTVAGYLATGAKVTAATALTAHKLAELRTGLESTKNLVPHPPEHRGGDALLAGRDWRDDEVTAADAKTEAVRVLHNVYARVVHDSDVNVPVIPLAADQGTAPPAIGGV
ncbi:hypothetical protein ACFO5K_08460 [Nocardia halotolerans]|uniref:PPE family protein n=1 Tax=Nocardia halotolerans TaxID=1755878 RepID=A0ABV8VEV2_9NOCA